MTRLDEDEALILAQARNGLGPTSSDERRLLHNVLVQVAMTPVAPVGQSAGGIPKSPWPLRIAGSMAVMGAIALSGGLGYHQGWEAGIATQNRPETQPNTVPHAPSTDDVQVAPVPPMAPAGSAVRAPLSPRERHSVQDKPTLGSSAMRVPSSAPTPSVPLGLDEEVRQLRRVERAIRERNPRLALVLLEEMDQAMPAGQLMEERRAASIMASCQLDGEAAQSHARAFVRSHDGSVYLARVIEICGLENERKPAALGTHTP
jgi:hypothetical protein